MMRIYVIFAACVAAAQVWASYHFLPGPDRLPVAAICTGADVIMVAFVLGSVWYINREAGR